MTHPYRIAVVIPCHNHGEFVGAAVESVLRAKRADLGVIVVDDGSTDERTAEAMEVLRAQGIRVIHQGNKGLSAARNAGIVASDGEYIFPLDADDRMRTEWIDRAIRILDGNPKVGVVCGDLESFGAMTGRWRGGPFDLECLLGRNYIPCSALYRRAVWEQNGGYDERMLLGYEDWDFWLGAVERGWKFAYLPEVFFDYRRAAESMLTRAEVRRAEVGEYIAKKHASLYRHRWLWRMRGRLSIRRVAHRLTNMVVSRRAFRESLRKFRVHLAEERRCDSER